MTTSQLQDYIFHAKYARWDPQRGRRESWAEAVERVMAMHARRYAGRGVDGEISAAKQAMLERLALGSQRALQFGGAPIEEKHARLYNCTVSYCDRPRFFQEALWLLLCGCGVGFSVQRHHIARLPPLTRPRHGKRTVVVDDSIEGWADALGALLSGFLPIEEAPYADMSGWDVEFDLRRIRRAGARLGSGGGRAPGPEPLRRSLERVRGAIISRLERAGDGCRLTPIDCYDILMHAADAVLSGGVRRSACICVFSPDDEAMAMAKTGDWLKREPQRARSNNSALLLRDATSAARFHELLARVCEFGEPGFVWADSTEILYNPCVEIGMYPVDVATGASGWAFCNLCEINLAACVDRAVFARAARAAAILGTLQAGYTDFAYLGPTSIQIARREALLGCSMTGMMDNPSIAFDAALQREMAALVLAVNADVAAKIGVAPTARATCVKPAGSTSLILGTAAGIHPHHARRYFRRVQANRREPAFRRFAAANPTAVEPSRWNVTDAVLTFCVEAPPAARTRDQVDALELLRLVELTQENWVAAGKRAERCAQPWLSHNVSNTITVRDDEWDAVGQRLYDHRRSFAGIALLPASGELDYPQAPLCAVWTRSEIASRWGAAATAVEPLALGAVEAFGDAWSACACLHDAQPTTAAQQAWVAAARAVLEPWFGADRREFAPCVQRLADCRRWDELVRAYREVDYAAMDDDAPLPTELDPACAGGDCLG